MLLKLGITKLCTRTIHLHPAPSISTRSFQPKPSFIHIQPAHLSLHPAPCDTPNVIRTSISHVSGNFPKFRPKNWRLSILLKNWHFRKLGGADSKSGLTFLKLGPKIYFEQIWAEKVKVISFAWKLVHMIFGGCWFLFQR